MTQHFAEYVAPARDTYVNDGNFYRFVARNRANHKVFYAVTQGNRPGQECNYVRVDATLDVTIHRITKMYDDRSFEYDPTPLNYEVTWS